MGVRETMTSIQIPVSPGELLDKISILRLKSERIRDAGKQENVRFELQQLQDVADREIAEADELAGPVGRLFEVNGSLWDVEDALREHEQRRDFGDAFVALARSVYVLNDERAALKRTINDLLGASIVEEKSYGSGA